MTLTSVLTKVSFSGNGSTTVFAVSFVYYDNDGLRVLLVNDTTGVEVVQTLTTQYTLSGGSGATGMLTMLTTQYTLSGGSGATGTLTMLTAPASGETLIVKSDIDDTQETDFPTGGNLRSTSIEEQMDILTRLIQQKKEQISRMLILKESTTLSDLAFPDPVADAFIKWNNAATALETATGVDFGPASVTSITVVKGIITAIS